MGDPGAALDQDSTTENPGTAAIDGRKLQRGLTYGGRSLMKFAVPPTPSRLGGRSIDLKGIEIR